MSKTKTQQPQARYVPAEQRKTSLDPVRYFDRLRNRWMVVTDAGIVPATAPPAVRIEV